MNPLNPNEPTTSSDKTQHWDTDLYDARHAFVWQSATDLLQVLDPQPGEKILDAGCGTGHLTAQIAEKGAHVIGLDVSSPMINAARREYLHLNWYQGDLRDFDLGNDFDAVFSNATLHWVRPPEAAISCIARALKPGGRLVCEFGGKGNVSQVLDAIAHALQVVNIDADPYTNYFPSLAEYTSLLENAGLETRFATIFDRPTPLQGPDGLRNWVRQFRAPVVQAVPLELHETFFRAIEDAAQDTLCRDNNWFADYVRLRLIAFKTT